MSKDPVDQRLRELSWRRKLTSVEEAQLQAWAAEHPEAQAEWEAETGLTDALARLDDAPLSSNFTARVLQAIELETAAQRRRQQQKRVRWLARLAPKLALAGFIGASAVVLYQQVHEANVRAEVRRSVVNVSAVQSLPTAEALENFEVIRALSTAPVPDDTLLTLLQ